MFPSSKLLSSRSIYLPFEGKEVYVCRRLIRALPLTAKNERLIGTVIAAPLPSMLDETQHVIVACRVIKTKFYRLKFHTTRALYNSPASGGGYDCQSLLLHLPDRRK